MGFAPSAPKPSGAQTIKHSPVGCPLWTHYDMLLSLYNGRVPLAQRKKALA
nr:MAG TPA: hypothetical protein [Caudoviricetes sp.]